MKKQSGFTLIELLLVLAIIGIISAIAIPALLSQRARARDKSAMANLDSVIADGVGQWDKAREQGSTPTNAMTAVMNYLINGHTKDKNPWNTAQAAYNFPSVAVNTYSTTSAFLTTGLGTPTPLGQVQLKGLYSTSTLPGFIGGAVLLQNTVNGSITYRKAAAVE